MILGLAIYRRWLAPLWVLAVIIPISGCAEVKSGINSAAAHLDQAFGAAPAAEYDLLTDADVEMAAAALQQALETRVDGEAVRWRNADSGNAGAITPLRTYLTDAGVYCRDYQETVVVAGREGVAENVGCRDDGGFWTWVQ